jgi:Flp pilus assembly protein TadD
VQLARPQEAITQLRQALQLNPKLISAHAILGKALAEIGQLTEAAQQMELAKATDTDGSLHYQLSTVYRRLGEPEKANQALMESEKIRRDRRQAMGETVVLRASEQSDAK